MEKRALGKTGFDVSAICFGGNVLGFTADEPTSFKILDAFVGAGGNFVDTADVYPRFASGHEGGESETILGKWLGRSGNRDRVVLVTKVGGDMGNGKGLSRKHILQSADGSLRRLQTDHIDVYLTHRDDDVTPVEETLEAYAELIRQGKVRKIGASNVSVSRLTASLQYSQQHGIPAYEVLQPLYNLYDRATYEQQYEKIAQEHHLGVMVYFALASGFLSGKYRSAADIVGRPREKFLGGYFNERGMRILSALDEVANNYNVTPTQIALAWILARPSVTSPIISATSLEQLKQITSASAIKLDPSALERLNQASAYA
ncbi:MAG TPA: aldo/keto reductase [Ktedonobacteraceae bacterium]|jgi:aryl-alcohol dehydrogenase-like predicted oxidoreductase|nr:aldo/keto reductase [Ktedonobacteraceae bacterium]